MTLETPQISVLIVQSVELDKRMAASFPELRINESIRDEALALALKEEAGSKDASASPEGIRTIQPVASSSDTDKALLRLFVTYQVLQRLGFAEARIAECINRGLGEGDGWEEALEWVSATA